MNHDGRDTVYRRSHDIFPSVCYWTEMLAIGFTTYSYSVILCVLHCFVSVQTVKFLVLCAFVCREAVTWLNVFSNRSFSAARRLLGASGGHCKHAIKKEFMTG